MPLTCLLLICASAALSGARNIEESAEWGQRAPGHTLHTIGVRPHLLAWRRAPTAPTLERVLARIDTQALDAVDPTVQQWRTTHADLHWNNLLGPDLGLLDWESWGRAPAGLDAATLYCHSPTYPATARQVREVFADQLDTPDGMRAQLYVIARLLLRIERGDDPTVAPLLHRRAHELLS